MKILITANCTMKRTVKKCIVIVITIITTAIILHWWFSALHETEISQKYSKNVVPNLLWWTYSINYNQIKRCGIYKCRFSSNKNILNHSQTKAIIFYGSDININDFPLPRLNHHIWALFHEESPKNLAYIQQENVLKHFNYTATFSRYSNFPLTTQYLESYDELRSRKYVVPIGEKTKLRQNLAPIVFLQSICDAMSGRQEYIEELMKFIPIDSYGKCLNNRELPKSLSVDYLQTIQSDELYRFLAPYKFIISYENSVCNDYITEKFWRALTIGAIPIYFGSPTINDWLPNKKSAILISDFDSPKDLANFIKKLDKDDIEYNKYLDHKYSQIEPISNSLLRYTLFNRLFEKDNVIDDFECFLCNEIHNMNNNQYIHATKKHYDCPNELIYPKMNKTYDKNNWDVILRHGKCHAAVLDRLFQKNRNYTQQDFQNEMNKDIMNEKCIL